VPAFDLPLDELENHRPDIEEPADFDALWAATLKESGHPDPVLAVRPVDQGLRLVETWDITFRGFAGDPVRAWYTRPAGPARPLSAVVEYAGYGRGRGLPHERLIWANAGYAHLLMDNRGQGDQYGCGGDTPDPHTTAQGGPGPAVRGLLDPYDYHYRRLITDAVRAVAALRALPGVDATRVAAVGNSQGGGLALAVAGLVPDLAAVLVSAPFLCGIRRALDLTDAGPYGPGSRSRSGCRHQYAARKRAAPPATRCGNWPKRTVGSRSRPPRAGSARGSRTPRCRPGNRCGRRSATAPRHRGGS